MIKKNKAVDDVVTWASSNENQIEILNRCRDLIQGAEHVKFGRGFERKIAGIRHLFLEVSLLKHELAPEI